MANKLALDETLEITSGLPIFHIMLSLDNYLEKNSLEESKYIRIGEANTVHFERIRLKSYPDIKFHHLDIDKIKIFEAKNLRRENNHLIDIKSNIFSIYHSKRLFSPDFIESLHLQMKNKQFALVEFLNIFNTICISLYYQAWLKSDPNFYSHLRPKEITIRSGFYTTGFNANNKYLSKFISQNRTVSTLKNMLLEYVKHPLKIVQHVLEKIAPVHDKIYDPFTNEILLGDEEGVPLWDKIPVIHTKFSIIIGPLTHKEYRQFVPWGPNFSGLCRLTEDYLDNPSLNYDIEFLVTNIPEETDLSNRGFVIGFDMWMKDNGPHPLSKKYKPFARELTQLDVRSGFGITSAENNEWPADIFISEFNWDSPNFSYTDISQQPKTNKPGYFFSDISEIEEKKQDQAIKYFDKKKNVLASLLREYAADFPDSARAIGVDANGHVGDKDIAQFIQYFSFVAGLIRQKIDRTNEDRLLDMLRKLNPNLFLPLPATMIASFEPSEKIKTCQVLPRGTEIVLAGDENEEKKYPFTTSYDTVLIPAKITKIHCTRSFMGEHLREDLFNRCSTTLIIELESNEEKITFENMGLEFLRLYINLKSTKTSLAFHEILFMKCVGMDIYDISEKHTGDGFLGYVPPRDLHPVGFKSNEEVFPRPFKQENNLNTAARHLMREFSLYPQKFMFIDIKNLKNTLKGCGNKVQIRLFLDSYINSQFLSLINRTPDCLQIGTTPVVNLFNVKLEDIRITNETKPISLTKYFNESISDRDNSYVYYVEKFDLMRNNGCYERVKNQNEILSPYENNLQWKNSPQSVFSDPLHKYDAIDIVDSKGINQTFKLSSANITAIAHNKIDKELFLNLINPGLANKNSDSILSSIRIQSHSYTPTRENPHLLKGPYPFLQNMTMRNFYHPGNYNLENFKEYLNTFVSKKGDIIDNFITSLEYVRTSMMTGEGKLPTKRTKMIITNGMKFCFEFSGVPAEHKKIRRTEIFLLIHIISEHLAEMCNHLSFVKVGYRYTKPLQEEEKYFNKKIYLGKRGY